MPNMPYHDRKYKAYVVLGDPAAEPLWHWSRWCTFAAQLDPVFAACRGKALLHTGQFEMATKREVKFGRLGWSAESHAKWVHSSPVTADASKNWSFFFVEASAPSLPACGREGVPPDFFFVVSNEAYVTRRIPVEFNPRIFLAVANELPTAVLQKVEEAARGTSVMVAARLAASIDRPWGYSAGVGFTHAIQDIAHVGLFKVGQPHTRPLDVSTFVEPWHPL